MNNLPMYVSVVFALTTFLTIFIFYKATHNSKTGLIIILLWLALQSALSFSGFYSSNPVRFFLAPGPPFIFIIILFATKNGRKFIDNLKLKTLTILHIVRIPVEIVLFWLFLYKTIPQVMTFEGRNFDILSGLTAPLVYYFAFRKNKLSTNILLVWNFICLALLFNIVVHAVLSAPLPIQQMAFDQPNIAVLYFPFVWLPCCIVPLVLLSHLAAIRQLVARKGVASKAESFALQKQIQ
jgi:hypothetical protein